MVFPVIDNRRDFTHGDLLPLPEYQGAVVPSKGVSVTGHVIYPDFISRKQGTEIIKKKS